MSKKIEELKAQIRRERYDSLEADKAWQAKVSKLQKEIYDLKLYISGLEAAVENNIDPNIGNLRVYTE